MIIDSIAVFDRYVGLNKLFSVVADFLRRTDLSTLPVGKTTIQGDDVFINIQEAAPKARSEAQFETHRRMIDVQIPISDSEEHGWTPADQLPEADYDEATDMTLHGFAESADGSLAHTYFTLRPGQFAIYFPTDGHAPAITPTGLRKGIIKVRV